MPQRTAKRNESIGEPALGLREVLLKLGRHRWDEARNTRGDHGATVPRSRPPTAKACRVTPGKEPAPGGRRPGTALPAPKLVPVGASDAQPTDTAWINCRHKRAEQALGAGFTAVVLKGRTVEEAHLTQLVNAINLQEVPLTEPVEVVSDRVFEHRR